MAVRALTFRLSDNPTSDWQFSSGSSPYKRKKARTGQLSFTPQQALEYAARVKASGDHGHSFTDALKHVPGGLGHGVLKALELTQRPIHAVNSALLHGGEGSFFMPGKGGFDYRKALHGAQLGITGKEHISGSQLLKAKGILVGHNKLRGIAGLAEDIAIDPTTYLTLGTAGVAKGVTSKAALAASAKLAATELPAVTAQKGAYRIALRALQPHTKVLAAAAAKHPESFTARANAAAQFERTLARGAAGRGAPALKEVEHLDYLRQAAHAEGRQITKRALTLRWAGKDIAKAPAALALPARGALGKAGVPVLSKAAASLGEKFKPGYADPVTHAVNLTRQRKQEQFAQRYLDKIALSFKGHKQVERERQVGVLHYFEKKGGVVKDEHGKFVLSKKAKEEARKAGFTEHEIEFAEKMHQAGEYLAAQDKEFGLRYEKLGEQGKMYVPHILDRDTAFIKNDMGRDLISQRGYLKKRKGDSLTLRDIEKLHAAGKLPQGIEADPFKLLVMRARAAASQHADVGMIDTLKQMHGIPVRLVDETKLMTATQKVAALASKIENHPTHKFNGEYSQEVKRLTGVYKSKLQKQHQELIDKHTGQIRTHLDRDHTKTTMATVTRISNRTAAAKVLYNKAIRDIGNGRDPGLRAVLQNLRSARETALKDLSSTRLAHKQARKELKALTKGKKNPAYDPMLHGTVEGRGGQKHLLLGPGGHDVAFPHEIKDAMTRLSKVSSGDEKTIQQFETTYRRWVSKWKLGVTAVNPAYGIRNTVSDAWNMWLSGVPMHAMVSNGARAAKLMHDFGEYGRVIEKGGKPTQAQIEAVQTLREAYGQGVLSGLFQGDVQLVAAHLKSGKGVATLLKDKRYIKAYTKFATDLNRNRENWGRLTHYIYRRETKKMGVADAAFEVKKAHFDYEDLTPFEQKHMKAIAPFYTWTRKNLPYQIESLAMRPGRVAGFPKLGENMSDSLGEDRSGSVPGYIEGGLSLPLGGNKYLSPMAGITDLMKLQNPKEGIASLIAPQFKLPAELMLNRSSFTGAPIKDPAGHPRVPIRDGLVADLLGAIPGNPLDVGQTTRGDVSGAGMNPYAAYIAGQLPFTNALVNHGSKIKQATKIPYAGGLAYGLGLNVTKVDPEQQKLIDELNFQDKWKGMLKGMRDEGKVAPAKKRKKSANQRFLEAALQGRR